jgi:hypothetical protein
MAKTRFFPSMKVLTYVNDNVIFPWYTHLLFHVLLFSSRTLRYPFLAMQGDTLISSSSGIRLKAGEGGLGACARAVAVPGEARPSSCGRFSRIRDRGRCGSGDSSLRTASRNLDISVIDAVCTVIPFVRVSAKFSTGTVVSINESLVEAKMCPFSFEFTHLIFNKCPIYSHDSANAKFSTSSHETDYSVWRLHGALYR